MRKLIAVLLTLALVLVLPLVACASETEGTTEQSGEANPLLRYIVGSDADDPDETALTPEEAEIQAVITEFFRPTLGEYNRAIKAHYEKTYAYLNKKMGMDIEKSIKEAHEKYGEFYHEIITEDVVRVGILTASESSYIDPQNNPIGISPAAAEKANDFLKDKGMEPLKISDPTQGIAALWLAMSLFYDPNVAAEEPMSPYWDIARSFALAVHDPSDPDNLSDYTFLFWNNFAHLFDYSTVDIGSLVDTVGVLELIRHGVNPEWYMHYCNPKILIDEFGVPDLVSKYHVNLDYFIDNCSPQSLAVESLIDAVGLKDLITVYGVNINLLTDYFAIQTLVDTFGSRELITQYGINPILILDVDRQAIVDLFDLPSFIEGFDLDPSLFRDYLDPDEYSELLEKIGH